MRLMISKMLFFLAFWFLPNDQKKMSENAKERLDKIENSTKSVRYTRDKNGRRNR